MIGLHSQPRYADMKQVQYHGLTEEERFMKRVEKQDNGCWNWTGSRHKEKWHGQWRNKAGGIELTHRAAWRMFKCEIPEGMSVLHKCDNPICVNPSHLWLGTQSDNCHDMWRKGRAKPKTLLGEKHGMSRLKLEQVIDIKTSKDSGIVLAKKYGISPTTVCDIRRGRSWTHVAT